MANDAVVNMVRKNQSYSKYFDEQMFVQSAEDHPADAGMLVKEMERRIKQVIENMPPQRRMVYKLSREKNLTYIEIARQMNLSPETVEIRRHGRRILLPVVLTPARSGEDLIARYTTPVIFPNFILNC